MAAASAVVDRLLLRLASDAQAVTELPLAVEEDIIHLRKALSRWHLVLDDAEKQLFVGISGDCKASSKIASKKNTMRKIKQIAYEIEDILDQIEDRCVSRSTEEVFCCSSGPFFFPCTMASRMKMIRRKLDRASENSVIFSLLQHNKLDLESSNDHAAFDTTSIIGRDGDRENVQKLINDAGPFSIIPVVGLAGIGKTSLVRLIFNEQGEDCKFDHHVWISLNKSFDLINIANAIIAQTRKNEGDSSQNNLEILKSRLREVLSDKKCLLVLDDLWSTDRSQLDELKEMLSDMICSVIVTTSSEEVAELFNTVRPYKLGLLSDENCRTIFSKVPFGEEETRNQAVRKCEGMPIIARSLGSLVNKKSINVWEDAKNEELWYLEKRFAPRIKMFPSLKQIYYRMPSGLKACFAYLSIFPKGCNIDAEKLIRQWGALDMLGSNHGILPPYAQGKNYIQTLLSLFFLQALETPLANGMVRINDRNVLKMHSLVHSFSRYVASDEIIILDDEKTPISTTKKVSFRYALLLKCNIDSTLRKALLTKARAVSFKGCNATQHLEETLSVPRHLYLLDLSECSFLELPSSVGQLKHLRYLDVSHSAIQSLPTELSSLQNLEALDLSKTSIKVLPDSIGPFEKLKYLNLQECLDLQGLLRTFGHLKGLEHLNLSGCSGVSELPGTLCDLHELQYLDISSCAELEKLPQLFGSLKNLCDLNLSGCSRLKQLPESFDGLYSLLFLNLANCSMLQQLPPFFGNLKCLEELNLSGCTSLQQLPKSFGDLYFLRFLSLENCSGLHELPGFLGNLLNLENLNLSYISLELPESLSNLRRLHTLGLNGCGFKESFACIANKMENLKFVLTDHSRLALSLSQEIRFSAARHELQSSDLEGSGRRLCNAGRTYEDTPEILETGKGTKDKANLSKVVMEDRDPSAGMSNRYGSEHAESSAENTSTKNQAHGQGKEISESPAEQGSLNTSDPQDINLCAPSTLSDIIVCETPLAPGFQEYAISRPFPSHVSYPSQSMPARKFDNSYTMSQHNSGIPAHSANTMMKKQAHGQEKEISESPTKQQQCTHASDCQELNQGGSSTLSDSLIRETHLTPGFREYHNIDFPSSSHASYPSLSLPAQKYDNSYTEPQHNSGIPETAMLWGKKLLLAAQKVIPGRKEESRTGVQQIYHLMKEEYSLRLYRLSHIKAATGNFSDPIGAGGFGTVYKGQLPDGLEIAVKRYWGGTLQGLRELEKEIRLSSRLMHRNLLRLVGYCINDKQEIMSFFIRHKQEIIMLIYEYMPNKSLDRFIFDTSKRQLLSWHERLRIIYGIAQGLLYLHEFSQFTVLHMDIKPSNILLDHDMNPKIHNFGIAKILPSNMTEVSTIIAGTMGYIDPEYVRTSICSAKCDVYSFGVTVLEILSEKREFKHRVTNQAWRLWRDGKWHELIDPALYDTCEDMEVRRCIHVALLCVQDRAGDRPTMHDVTAMLRHEHIIRPEPKQPPYINLEAASEGSECSLSL